MKKLLKVVIPLWIEISLLGFTTGFIHIHPGFANSSNQPKFPSINETIQSPPLDENAIQNVTLIAAADSYINSIYPSNNYGSAGTLYVGLQSTSKITRSLVLFNLSPVPENATILSANLDLYRSTGSTSPPSLNIAAFRPLSNWEENKITWNNQPGRTPLAKVTPVDSTNGYYRWEITSLVQEWINGDKPNYGVMLAVETEVPPGYRGFFSREAGNFPPRLLIQYTEPAVTADPQVLGLRRLQSASSQPVRFRFRNGIPEYIHAQLPVGSIADDPLQRARAYLDAYKDLYRLMDATQQFRLVRRKIDGPLQHIFLQQLYQGIPVFAAEIGIHFKNNIFTSSSGAYLPNLDIPIQAKVSYLNAEQVAKNHYQSSYPAELLIVVGQTALTILDRSLWTDQAPDPRLAWLVNLRSEQGDWSYFVDARTGTVIHRLGKDHEVMDLEIYDGHNNFSRDPWCWTLFDDPSTLVITEEGHEEGVTIPADAETAEEMIDIIYDYYNDQYDLESFDGDNGQIELYVRVDLQEYLGSDNARWRGCGDLIEFSPDYVQMDIFGHEYTHGIISEDYDPPDEDMPGTIEESLGDILGTILEGQYQDHVDWQIGDELLTGDVRDLFHPPLHSTWCGNDEYVHPDHNDDFYHDMPCDHGGIHTNIGILNKAAWLISTQGTHEFHNVSVTSLGIDTADDIFYHAMKHHLTSNSQFIGLREAMIESAETIYGIGSPEVCTVRNAYHAVGLGDIDTDCDGVEDTPDEDDDDDGIGDAGDNCRRMANPNQEDNDEDGWGDICDSDDDNDMLIDSADNCDFVANPSQLNTDGDLYGEACDDNQDNDGIPNTHPDDTPWDNCPNDWNHYQENRDGDENGGDACDPDDDNDDVLDNGDGSKIPGDNYCHAGNYKNCDDNAPLDWNPNQEDGDGDGVGDVVDNCLLVANPYNPGVYPPVQQDTDEDGHGDACDSDLDGDDVPNSDDNCPFHHNPEQINIDMNEIGLKCDQDEAFMLSGGPHLFFIEFPAAGPLVLPVFPCLADGCPEPTSVFPEGQRVAITIQMEQTFHARIVNEAGSLVDRSLNNALFHELSFPLHPSYRFDLEAMNRSNEAFTSQATIDNQINPQYFAQRPLYFLEIWPTQPFTPGQTYQLQFDISTFIEKQLVFLPMVRR